MLQALIAGVGLGVFPDFIFGKALATALGNRVGRMDLERRLGALADAAGHTPLQRVEVLGDPSDAS